MYTEFITIIGIKCLWTAFLWTFQSIIFYESWYSPVPIARSMFFSPHIPYIDCRLFLSLFPFSMCMKKYLVYGIQFMFVSGTQQEKNWNIELLSMSITTLDVNSINIHIKLNPFIHGTWNASSYFSSPFWSLGKNMENAKWLGQPVWLLRYINRAFINVAHRKRNHWHFIVRFIRKRNGKIINSHVFQFPMPLWSKLQ